MKKLLLTIALLVGLAFAASAQTSYRVTPSSSFLSWTNLAAAATNVGLVIDVRGSQYASLFISVTNDAATTDNMTYVLYRSLDGTTNTMEAAAVAAIAIANTGTTWKNTITNVTTFGCGYLILGYTTNAAATANAVVKFKYALKTNL